jgi:hypothetical protein
MRRRLARAFVTTVSIGAVVACSKPTPPTEEISHNPPEPPPDPEPPPALDAAAEELAAHPVGRNPPGPRSDGGLALRKRKRTAPPEPGGAAVRYPTRARVLNSNDDRGRMIYAGRDDRCVVEARPPGPPPRGMGAPTLVQVTCPPSLDDPAWDHCPDRLVLDEESGACVCAPSFGNPPPPPHPTACPAGVAKR